MAKKTLRKGDNHKKKTRSKRGKRGGGPPTLKDIYREAHEYVTGRLSRGKINENIAKQAESDARKMKEMEEREIKTNQPGAETPAERVDRMRAKRAASKEFADKNTEDANIAASTAIEKQQLEARKRKEDRENDTNPEINERELCALFDTSKTLTEEQKKIKEKIKEGEFYYYLPNDERVVFGTVVDATVEPVSKYKKETCKVTFRNNENRERTMDFDEDRPTIGGPMVFRYTLNKSEEQPGGNRKKKTRSKRTKRGTKRATK
jgi:hypothetical protein